MTPRPGTDGPRRYVVAWNLSEAKVVVAGAGRTAESKVEGLRSSGARLVVVGPEPTDRLRDLASAGRVELVERPIRRRDLLGARLVVAATGDSREDRRVGRWARALRALVIDAGAVERCDLTVPSVVRRGSATIAIATDGTSPATARFLREEIDEALPSGVTDLIDEAARARRVLREHEDYRIDYPAWRQRFLEPGLQAVRDGRTASLGELRRRFVAGFPAPTPIRSGHVTLVGAGPGGIDLITVRGAAALAAADVVVYDRLADLDLLDLAPVTAERIPVGKSKGHGMHQDEINAILVDRAASGAHVVRLKGGDPFVFGRGSEEIDAVEAAGLTWEVVPGVSSALGGPALAGVPVTHRGVAASFTVMSGHRIEGTDHDWESLARSSTTLVVMMGASTATSIASRLIASGRAGTEPVAVVHRAGSPEMRTATTTLDGLATDGCPFPAPCVIVIGETAARASSGDRSGRSTGDLRADHAALGPWSPASLGGDAAT